MDYLYILIIAIILDFVLGDPSGWPHPIVFIGWIIKKIEKLIRKQRIIGLKIGGFALVALTLTVVFLVIEVILQLSYLIHPIVFLVISTYLTYTGLAAKCLDTETRKVYNALRNNDIKNGRKMLSFLVGRDTTQLSKEEITRGAVETVAENTVDGVLAPIFYFIIGIFIGMPVQLMFIYKAINTLDSMVGYTQPPYKEIGFASAKLDDIANYIPARIGSLFMLLTGIFFRYDIKNGFKILLRDRRNHKSPNCGYPESVVAGLLEIQLGGTNTYFGKILYKPTIGDPINDLRPKNIIDTIKIMYGSEITMVGVFSFVYMLFRV